MTTTFTIDAGSLTQAHTKRGPRVFLLIHIQGAERSSRIIELPDGAEVTFGRSRAATVMVDHDSVSRLHARIRRRGDTIDVEDLESRNGTIVDGERIAALTAVAPGSEIAVGPATALVGMTSRVPSRGRVSDSDGFEARLAAELDRVVRYRRRAAVVAMKILGDDDVIDALAGLVRPMDLLAELDDHHFALLAPELNRIEVELAMRRFIDEAAAGGTDVRVGIAMAPDDGLTVDALLEASRAALRRVKTPRSLMHAPPRAPVESSELVLADPAMKQLYATIERIAEASLTVLVFGETGVGKELVTEALHRASPRRDKPLVKLNCASLPESLLESELFGYERGAFTGAERRKLGFFEASDGGTLFLDEIGEMPLPLQAKLLRVLERKTITRVGGTQEIAVDVRLVAATHRDLDAEVRAGRFREDLFFRIAGFTVYVPPLRDRKGDLLPLAEFFLRKVALESGAAAPQLDDDARAALLRHDWPGNVRELKNAMERAMVMQSDGVIKLEHLPERLRARAPHPVATASDGKIRDQLAEIERVAITSTLEITGGNQTHAALRLGISRRTLIYKMEKYGLKAPPKSAESDG
jgi:two-component system, NtrC family, response regulator AtoC